MNAAILVLFLACLPALSVAQQAEDVRPADGAAPMKVLQAESPAETNPLVHPGQRPGWVERIATDVHDGMASVTEWYDAPALLAFLLRNYYKEDNPSAKLLRYPATPFEQRIAGSVGTTGQVSLGSMDAWVLPGVVLGSRVLWALGNNIAGDADMTESYARTWTFTRVLMYNFLATELVKNVVNRPRPDGSDTKSFFSGHTSTAFVTSAFLARELDDLLDEQLPPGLTRSALTVAGYGALYGWAGYVGWSRMADNKHFLVDVLLGAAVGSLIGNVVYDHYFGSEIRDLPAIGLGFIDDQPAMTLSLKF